MKIDPVTPEPRKRPDLVRTELGQKKLSPKNLTTPDWICARGYGYINNRTGREFRATAEFQASRILRIKLDPSVPEKIQGLFAVARGIMCYGHFYYPLFTIAEEQLHRVAEAAVTIRCMSMDGPGEDERFFDKLEFLYLNDVIPVHHRRWWDLTRKLRNHGAHPTSQAILGITIGSLRDARTQINALFGAKPWPRPLRPPPDPYKQFLRRQKKQALLEAQRHQNTATETPTEALP